jgi:diaminohydroxyphosphoribosylaminopyrimidine deaminase / 5-amino-6-(5-phosphoribosylamino)uracil reductase
VKREKNGKKYMDNNINNSFMQEAVTLAKKAWGQTSPNPLVGAVVVKDGIIVGRGYHHRAGEAHAEVNALNDAGSDACGADIYVTLEPCSTTGRTPPCTEAIIDAKIKTVYIGSVDPNPAHRGNAVKVLEGVGVKVICDIEKTACDQLNEAFFCWITTGKPFVLLKMAMTLDGKIATADGCSQWITGPVARERVQRLRQWADAVMVGGATARTDHPSLTVRNIEQWNPQPRRIIVSNSLSKTDLEQMLVAGGDIETVSPSGVDGWNSYLEQLGSDGVTALLIEGGGELAGEVLAASVVDKVEFHIAMKILGGRDSRPVIGGTNPAALIEAVQLKDVKTEYLDNDLAISGYPIK